MKRIGLNKISLGAVGTPLVSMNTIGYHSRSTSTSPTPPTPSHPSWLFRDMVLWYDISKQGATNDSLRLSPVLKDFSGNGHDMELRNFAWSGMSGIGDDVGYPHQLVTDGVDDYGIVDLLPLLEDFTVIAKRKILSTELKDMAFISKRVGEGNYNGAFVLEKINKTKDHVSVSFGDENIINDFWEGDITYMTKTSYNGIPISSGSSQDTNILILAGGTRSNSGAIKEYMSVALSSVLLFNRSLSQEEIDYVIDNLIGRPENHYLLLEDTGYLLLEDGSKLTLE